MRKTVFLTVCLLALWSMACQNDPSEKDDSSPTAEAQSPETPVDQAVVLKVTIDQLRMREAAGEKGKEILRLPEGSMVTELGEISDFTTRIRLRGVSYDEPWLKVKTAEGQEGWVYAGGVGVSSGKQQAYSRRLLKARLESFFGAPLTDRVETYGADYQAMKTSKELAKVFREGVELRDTLVDLFNNRVVAIDPLQAPDLEWLERAMPGFNTQLVAEGTQAYLFANFKEWSKQAKATEGGEDDRFTEIAFMIHEVDSIEHFYPAWFMQTWDYGGHSLLGQQIHKKVLDAMNAELENSRLFEQEFQTTKNQLIDDITLEYVTYWEPQQKILKELDAILESNYALLTKEDRIELQSRRKMFEKAKANKIELNQRSGM